MVEYVYAYMLTHLCLIRVTPIIFRSEMHSICVNCGKNISLLLLFLCVFIQINATQDVLCGFAFIIPIIVVYLFTSRFHALQTVVSTIIGTLVLWTHKTSFSYTEYFKEHWKVVSWVQLQLWSSLVKSISYNIYGIMNSA